MGSHDRKNSAGYHSSHFSVAMIAIKMDLKKPMNQTKRISKSKIYSLRLQWTDSLRHPNTEKAEKATAAGLGECLEYISDISVSR